eukprot:scaffold23000_cov235-Cylindrotheca_fusiformis.AAC.1
MVCWEWLYRGGLGGAVAVCDGGPWPGHRADAGVVVLVLQYWWSLSKKIRQSTVACIVERFSSCVV